MKQRSVVVSGGLILNQWDGDIMTASEHAGFHIKPTRFYRVSWPDHIVVKKYDFACIIHPESDHE